jgi:hypothetical protein
MIIGGMNVYTYIYTTYIYTIYIYRIYISTYLQGDDNRGHECMFIYTTYLYTIHIYIQLIYVRIHLSANLLQGDDNRGHEFKRFDPCLELRVSHRVLYA